MPATPDISTDHTVLLMVHLSLSLSLSLHSYGRVATAARVPEKEQEREWEIRAFLLPALMNDNGGMHWPRAGFLEGLSRVW